MKQGNVKSLPKGWETKKLKEVASYFIGLTYSPKDVSEEGIIVLRSSNIQNDILDFKDIVRVNKTIKENIIVQNGDILMCSRNGSKRLVGKTATIEGLNEKMTFGTFMTVIRSSYNPYLAWFFKSDEFREQLGIGENTMINQVTKYMLDDISLPIPPLQEQQRIVAILDEAFRAIDEAKANTEQNLKNAKELFESELQRVFNEKGDGWLSKPLGEFATFRNGMNYTKSSKGEVIKIAGVKDFKDRFWVPFDDLDSFTIDGKLNEIDILKEGDIIAVRSNGNPELIGRTLLAGNIAGKVSHSGFTIRIRLNSNIISPIYLCRYLKTSKTRKELVDSGNGVGIRSLNQGSLSSLIIPFPKSLKDQQTIVSKLDALREQTKKLEAVYEKKLQDLEELKKSVLSKAFSGEL